MSAAAQYPTLPLLRTPAFSTPTCLLNIHDRAQLSYDKAKAIGLSYAMDIQDILTPSQKFWDMHEDPVALLDGAAVTLLAIQYNLCAGTIAEYVSQRPELEQLVHDLLRFKKHGQFMLTELGHGLDIHHIETTATLLPSGGFVLNSPTPQSAKFMPPTIPAGAPCIAVVFARLMVGRDYRGIRPFIVSLNDGVEMCPGVRARLLPDRGGPNPVNHALTSFHDVQLPPSALLGSLEKPPSLNSHLLDITSRVSIGTMAFSHSAIPLFKAYATIGALYSLRRKTGSPENPQPILQYRTQQAPILTVTAQASVLSAFEKWATEAFMAEKDVRVRRGIAAISKAVAVQHSQAGCLAVSERCGAQGLFAHNQMTTLHSEMRGVAIAEGDILGLSIRLATELILGRYNMPSPRDPTSALAQHEAGLLREAREIIATLPTHRCAEVNRLILPRCQPLVEAIGHRMAYDAAVTAGVEKCLIDLYVAEVMKLDSAWYSENTQFNRRTREALEVKALDETLPLLQSLVKQMDVVPYINAPIVSDSKWTAFVDALPLYERKERFRLPAEQQGFTRPLRAHL